MSAWDFIKSFFAFLFGAVSLLYVAVLLRYEIFGGLLDALAKCKLYKKIAPPIAVLVVALCIGFSAHVSFSDYIIDARKSSSPAQTVQTAAPTQQTGSHFIDYAKPNETPKTTSASDYVHVDPQTALNAVTTPPPTPQPTVQIIDYSARTQSTGGALYGNSMIVYVSNYGKIHRYSSCSGMKYYTEMTYSAALAAGYSRCSNCF